MSLSNSWCIQVNFWFLMRIEWLAKKRTYWLVNEAKIILLPVSILTNARNAAAAISVEVIPKIKESLVEFATSRSIWRCPCPRWTVLEVIPFTNCLRSKLFIGKTYKKERYFQLTCTYQPERQVLATRGLRLQKRHNRVGMIQHQNVW